MDGINDPIVTEDVTKPGETTAGVTAAAVAAAAAGPPDGTVEAAKDWMQQAPDDLKKNEILAALEGVGPLCKAHVELHGELAELKKSIEVPGGLDGYKLGDPELPEGLAVDKDLELAFKQICIDKKIGLEQAKSLFQFYNTYLATRYNNVMQNRSNAEGETEKQLTGEWGADGWTAKTALIGKLVFEKAGKDAPRVIEVLDKAGVYADPATMKFLAAIASDYGQHRLVEGETPGIVGTGEPAEQKPQPGEPAKSVKYGSEFKKFAEQG